MTPSVLPERPLLKPWYRKAADDDRTILQYLDSVVVFRGRAATRLLPSLLPLLDGTRSVDDIVAELGPAARPATEKALGLLARHRLLTDGPAPSTPLNQAAAFVAASDPFGSPADAADRLRGAVAAVVGSGQAAHEVSRLVRASGVACSGPLGWDDDDESADLVVVAPSPAELPRLVDWNRRALDRSSPWLAVHPFDGRVALAGPLIVPGETACYECFRRRRAAAGEHPEELLAVDAAPAPTIGPPALDAVVAGLAAALVLRWLGAGDPSLAGRVVALDLGRDFGLRTHLVHRMPRCAVCSGLLHAPPPLPWRAGAA